MNSKEAISQLVSRYKRLRGAEVALLSFAVAAGTASLLVPFRLSVFVTFAIAVVIAVLFAVWRYYQLRIHSVMPINIAGYLDRFYPELKDSTDLLLKADHELSSLELIQLERVRSNIAPLLPEIKFPHRIPQSAIILAGAAVVLTIMLIAAPYFPSVSNNASAAASNTADSAVLPLDPSMKSAHLTIVPPPYTRLPETSSDNLSFSAVEGSLTTWTISFHQPVSNARIVMTTGDSIIYAGESQEIKFQQVLTTSVLYRIRWTANGEFHSSDYHRIDVRPDHVPQVAIKDLPQFTRLKWGEKNTIDVTSSISDDYGLTAGHVIATVSKGSGESVKFREEKIAFSSPKHVSGTNVSGKVTLDFKRLGMEPGDEVYFYVEAFDNKMPTPQRNRTDTYFVALQDTAKYEIAMEDGLGVDLMPDYFRSQRQLIIDTEKLLVDQKKITKHQFNSTSNELGYDQKVLRLRYGQFLGEEFETSIGETVVEEQTEGPDENGEKKEEDLLKKYGHQHDTKNEHNLVPDKRTQAREAEEHQHEEGEEEEDPIAAYRHNHDSEEEATFFTQSIKTKLRAALTLMWDSELHLRLYHPKESLPYQYQILKLLKEISNDSRIYVHRMGFDPPPLKEDKRLTGLLDEVNPARTENKATTGHEYPAIRTAISDLSNVLLADSIVLTPQQKNNLHAAGDELAGLALKSPGNYLQQLSKLKLVAEDKAPASEMRVMLEDIQRTLWSVLPNEAPSPTQRGTGSHPLDVKFLEEIKAKAND